MSLPILPTGAYPLSRAQGIGAAILAGAVALVLLLVVPVLARVGNVLVVPPDAVRFGAASLVPPLPERTGEPGWRVAAADTNSVTLTKGGVTVRARTGVTELDLSMHLEELLSTYPRSQMSGPGGQAEQLGPVGFHSRGTATDGYIAWLEGARRSAVMLVVPVYSSSQAGGTAFVELVADGPTDSMERLGSEIDTLLNSIRFSGGGPG